MSKKITIEFQILALILVFLSKAALPAFAATCEITAGSLAFGTYDPLSPGPRMSNGTVEVTCFGANETVTLEILANMGFAATSKRMLAPSRSGLQYSLYLDPARTQTWGDGTNGTATIRDSLTLLRGSVTRTYSIYGRIPAVQKSAPAGPYQDQVLITIRYAG